MTPTELDLLEGAPPSPAVIAHAVNGLVARGERDALQHLRATGDQARPRARIRTFEERRFWLLRLLYQPPAGTPLRPPRIGELLLPNAWKSLRAWPMFPLAESGKSWFVLAEGHVLIGKAESYEEYLAYCRAAGRFRSQLLPVPTPAEALADAEALEQAASWLASDQGKIALGNDPFWRAVRAQAERVQ
ncbi:MAG: hypothetical protein JNM76_02535 [Betaproteobacteria bacterium]|nr:hypothetical protein [Betaproteobacteria bacterium]